MNYEDILEHVFFGCYSSLDMRLLIIFFGRHKRKHVLLVHSGQSSVKQVLAGLVAKQSFWVLLKPEYLNLVLSHLAKQKFWKCNLLS